MNYNFINESFNSLISGVKVNKTELENFIAFKDNSFILKHNIDAISQFLKFLNSSENIFILNGFMGSGKTYVADLFIDFLSEDVLVFRNSYQEAITLDDVLLSLFKDFSIYHNEKRIILPKAESSIFSDKINAYIKYCNAPMLFIFDSFEINMRSKDTQKDILGFINYLSHFEKAKIVICSRSFKETDLISDDSVISYNLESLTREEMYDYLNLNSITGSKYEIEELYKSTRGHYILLELSVLIMNLLNISLTIFSSEYKKSTKNFLEFLISRILAMSSERFVKLLIILSIIRHGLSGDFLIKQNFASIEDINYLLQKHVIAEKFGQYYLKDYVKNEYIKSISTETKIKVHEYLVRLYDSELPLKPFERELFLSRQTMRQEITYHTKKIQNLNEELTKSGRTRLSEMPDFNYLTYSKNSGYESGMEKVKEKRYVKNIRNLSSDKRKRFELSKEDSLLLNLSSNSDNISKELKDIVDFQNKEEQGSKLHTDNMEIDSSVPNSLDDYIEIAQKYEDAFNYSSAILYYKKALTYKDDALFSRKEPVIYTKLAICYKKIQDIDEAVNYYEKVYQIYLEDSIDKANEILLSVAQMYNEIYKFDKAKEIYNRILYSEKGVSSNMIVRVYLDLSELEDNNLDIETSVKYAQRALQEAEKLSDIKLLTECYFKYALLLDDTGNTDLAQKYYLRCIQSSNNPEENAYLASAYSNLADLSIESNNISAAKMYYELSIEVDKKLNNYEGLYYSYSKLANINKEESPNKRYELLVKALSAAKRFDDISYAVFIYVEIGDYYFDVEDYKRALKSYMLAKTLIPTQAQDDIHSRINKGINKIKMLLGEIEFLKLMNEIKKKK